ncbi:hypothetical protein BDN70DRAFT_920189 [Pholiota conissans]|uniref:Uncharacterized protein n=1 Tax=Pholiota conissans TaxID=109636 RepID=A0A9P6D2B1_9AGAR|nr:hypothetical protein BDN70DRAFT_920189 [Pholiota conissans]
MYLLRRLVEERAMTLTCIEEGGIPLGRDLHTLTRTGKHHDLLAIFLLLPIRERDSGRNTSFSDHKFIAIPGTSYASVYFTYHLAVPERLEMIVTWAPFPLLCLSNSTSQCIRYFSLTVLERADLCYTRGSLSYDGECAGNNDIFSSVWYIGTRYSGHTKCVLLVFQSYLGSGLLSGFVPEFTTHRHTA